MKQEVPISIEESSSAEKNLVEETIETSSNEFKKGEGYKQTIEETQEAKTKNTKKISTIWWHYRGGRRTFNKTKNEGIKATRGTRASTRTSVGWK